MKNHLLRNVAIIIEALLTAFIVFSTIIIGKYSNSFEPYNIMLINCFVAGGGLVIGSVNFVLAITKNYYRVQRYLSYLFFLPMVAVIALSASVFTFYTKPLDMYLTIAVLITSIIIILLNMIDLFLTRKLKSAEKLIDETKQIEREEIKKHMATLPHEEIHDHLLEKLASIGSVLAIIAYSAITVALIVVMFTGILEKNIGSYLVLSVFAISSIAGIVVSIISEKKSASHESFVEIKGLVVSKFCLDCIYIVEFLTLAIDLITDWLVVSFILLVLSIVLVISSVFMIIALFDKEHYHEIERKDQTLAIYGSIFAMIGFGCLAIDYVVQIITTIIKTGNNKPSTILAVVCLIVCIVGLLFSRIISIKTKHHEKLKEVKSFIIVNTFFVAFHTIHFLISVPTILNIVKTGTPMNVLTTIIMIMAYVLIVLGQVFIMINLFKAQAENVSVHAQNQDIALEIEKYKNLLDSQVVTEEEFVKIKQKLIEKI